MYHSLQSFHGPILLGDFRLVLDYLIPQAFVQIFKSLELPRHALVVRSQFIEESLNLLLGFLIESIPFLETAYRPLALLEQFALQVIVLLLEQ